MSDFERNVPRDFVYAAIAARRLQWDNLLWQVPVLSLTAQAFLFTIALGADTSKFGRATACALSFVVSLLTVMLMARHRQGELADAHILRDMEKALGDGQHIHGEPWRAIRNATDVDAGWIGRRMPKKVSMYIVWTYGLLLFGFTAVVVGVVAVVFPDAL